MLDAIFFMRSILHLNLHLTRSCKVNVDGIWNELQAQLSFQVAKWKVAEP